MTDVYVIGSSFPALAAALEFAEVGLRVRVALDTAEPAAEPGGARDHDGALSAFLEHVSAPLADGDEPNRGVAPVAIAPQRVQLRNAKGGWTAQPMPAVFGIPAVPMDAESLAILGGSGAARAALDRIKPVLTIGKVHEIGTLVRNRMGKTALERLVAPFVRERFGASPDQVEVAVAAPGLNEAVTRAGSLSGAALALADRDVARETRISPRDGWPQLRASIISRLELYGAEIHRGLPLDAHPTAVGWRVTESDGHRLEVRVAVADPETVVPEAIAAACALVAPEAWRAHVRVEIEAPELADAALAAVQMVLLPSGETWSIRFECDTTQTWSAHLAGPRFERAPLTTGRSGNVDAAQQVDTEVADAARQVLAAADVTPLQQVTVELHPAPHLSLDRRDVETTAREALREAEPSLLLVGSSLFAGDLADAIADARSASVTVRRRLTGIAE